MNILGFWHFFVSRNPRNIRPESSSLVSTSLTHGGDDEDSEDSGIISLFVLLESPESSHRTQLQNVCIMRWGVGASITQIQNYLREQRVALAPGRINDATLLAPRTPTPVEGAFNGQPL